MMKVMIMMIMMTMDIIVMPFKMDHTDSVKMIKLDKWTSCERAV